MKRFVKHNSLSIVLFAIFFFSVIGMSIAGWVTNNEELQSHNQTQQAYGGYLMSGHFIEGVFENWESEFLQMWALVVLTVFLRQKGADDSKPLRGTVPQETRSRYRITRATTWPKKLRAFNHFIYAHSLNIVLLFIFIGAFSIHAASGAAAYNEESRMHGEMSSVSAIGYLGTSQFWYESLQNWQSEFFAVGCLLVLSIKLRERGSPESKPVGTRFDTKTGN